MSADKWLGDIYLLARLRLNKLGVERIYGSGVNEVFCTYTDQARFFSFRRDGATGRMASMIWLDATV
jgi:copper oxidase (laccase) domain-containing protein